MRNERGKEKEMKAHEIEDKYPNTLLSRMTTKAARLERINAKLLGSLEGIEGVIDDAVDTKIRSGRLPPIGGLLSTIQDEARTAIAEAKEA